LIRHGVVIGLVAGGLMATACSSAYPANPSATPTSQPTAPTSSAPTPASQVTPTATPPSPALPTVPPVAGSASLPSAAQLLAGVDATDATAVAQTFARGSWSIDTSTEASEVDAEGRLAALMTPDLAAEVEAATASAQPDATFEEWRRHQVVTTVGLAANNDSGAPPDTPTAADRSFVITITPAGRDGWAGPPISDVEFLSLTRPGPGEPWRISDVH
jgi:hypothetical protein